MPDNKFSCSSYGQHPEGLIGDNGLCPYFRSGACTLDQSRFCSKRRLKMESGKLADLEHVDMPDDISDLESNLDMEGLFDNTFFREVRMANSIIGKCSPSPIWNEDQTEFDEDKHAKMISYISDIEEIDFDMHSLSALYSEITDKAAALGYKIAKAKVEFDKFVSIKTSIIKEHIQNGVRLVKQTEKAVESILDSDPEYVKAKKTIVTAELYLSALDRKLTGITNHINVLKKRRDSLERDKDRQAAAGAV